MSEIPMGYILFSAGFILFSVGFLLGAMFYTLCTYIGRKENKQE